MPNKDHMTDNRFTSKRICGPNRRTIYTSQNRAINGLGIPFVVSAITACNQNNTAPATADRFKLVEEVQKTDPNFLLPQHPKAPSVNKYGAVAAQLTVGAEKTANAPSPDGTKMVGLR